MSKNKDESDNEDGNVEDDGSRSEFTESVQARHEWERMGSRSGEKLVVALTFRN
jgi:hypothetical protein